MHMLIHLPLFVISMVTYITIINRNLYKQHPLLFALYIFACLFLFFVLIILLVKLYGLISHFIDDYYVQTKGENDGNTGGRDPGSGHGSGPGSEPGPGGPGSSYIYPDTSNKKGKQKEENTLDERISHVNIVMDKYFKQAQRVHNDKSLTVHEKISKLDDLMTERNKMSTKSSSSYDDEQFIKENLHYVHQYKVVAESNLSQADKRKKKPGNYGKGNESNSI